MAFNFFNTIRISLKICWVPLLYLYKVIMAIFNNLFRIQPKTTSSTLTKFLNMSKYTMNFRGYGDFEGLKGNPEFMNAFFVRNLQFLAKESWNSRGPAMGHFLCFLSKMFGLVYH